LKQYAFGFTAFSASGILPIATKCTCRRNMIRNDMIKKLKRLESKQVVGLMPLDQEVDWMLKTIRTLDRRLRNAKIRIRRLSSTTWLMPIH